MAASDAQPFPIKNKALRLTFPIITAAGALVTTGTQTVTISKDQGTFANPSVGSTSATQVATTSGVWYVDLSATDLNADTVAVKVIDIFGNDTMTLVPVTVG